MQFSLCDIGGGPKLMRDGEIHYLVGVSMRTTTATSNQRGALNGRMEQPIGTHHDWANIPDPLTFTINPPQGGALIMRSSLLNTIQQGFTGQTPSMSYDELKVPQFIIDPTRYYTEALDNLPDKYDKDIIKEVADEHAHTMLIKHGSAPLDSLCWLEMIGPEATSSKDLLLGGFYRMAKAINRKDNKVSTNGPAYCADPDHELLDVWKGAVASAYQEQYPSLASIVSGTIDMARKSPPEAEYFREQ